MISNHSPALELSSICRAMWSSIESNRPTSWLLAQPASKSRRRIKSSRRLREESGCMAPRWHCLESATAEVIPRHLRPARLDSAKPSEGANERVTTTGFGSESGQTVRTSLISGNSVDRIKPMIRRVKGGWVSGVCPYLRRSWCWTFSEFTDGELERRDPPPPVQVASRWYS